MATLTESVEALAPPAPPIRARFLAAFAFGLLAVLAIAVGAMAAFERSFEGRILPGVHVGSVDLTGLSQAGAADRLADAFTDLAAGELVIAGPDSSTSIAYADVGRRLDADAVAAEALTVGRSGSFVERIAFDLRMLVAGQTVDLRAAVDRESLRQAVEAVAAGLRADSTDARVEPTADGFQVVPGVLGRSVDVDAAVAAAIAALTDPAAPDRVEVALAVSDVEPRVTTEDAEAAVAEAGRLAQDVTLNSGSVQQVIPAATIRGWLSFTVTADGVLRPVVDRTGPETELAAFAPKVALAPVEPQFIVDNQSVVGIIPGTDGAELDAPTSAQRVFQLLAARSDGVMVGTSWAAIAAVKPKLSDAEAASTAPKMHLISEWTTKFPYAINNFYGANIWIPAREIDGTVLAPGETFDFWKALGPITRERGYGDGGAIINGRSEPQGAFAGGICSTSTTLFNAAVRAGLEMGQRRNHYYYIGRYPLGLDATVYKSGSGSTQTMSFRNDTDYPILIRGSGWRVGSNGYVKFELYSVPTGRTVTFSNPTIKNVIKASDSVEYTTSLAPGARHRTEDPHDGMDVWVTRTVRDGSGAIVHQETFYSHYHRVTGILQIGVAPAPAPAPAPDPTPAPPPPDPTPAPSV